MVINVFQYIQILINSYFGKKKKELNIYRVFRFFFQGLSIKHGHVFLGWALGDYSWDHDCGGAFSTFLLKHKSVQDLGAFAYIF